MSDVVHRVRPAPGPALNLPKLPAFTGLMPWILPSVLIGIWQLGSSLGLIPEEFLASPLSVIEAGGRLVASGELQSSIAVSTQRAFSGLAVGGTLAFSLGLLNGLSPTASRLTDSTLQMVRNIPPLALIPLVILWFGIDEGAKLFLTAFGVFFPIYINTLHGIRSVDIQLVEMARSYGLGPVSLFRKVIFPGALPSILVGLRYALGLMWITLIVSETIAATSGIGYMAMHAREFMLVDVVVLSVIIYALLGKLADVAVGQMERRLLGWHPAFART